MFDQQPVAYLVAVTNAQRDKQAVLDNFDPQLTQLCGDQEVETSNGKYLLSEFAFLTLAQPTGVGLYRCENVSSQVAGAPIRN